MTGLRKMTIVELKLLGRDPLTVFFAVVFTPLLVAILGGIPAFRKPKAELGGLRVIDLYVPIGVTLILAMLALFVLPTYLATYRERGILRRLSVTPVPPSRLLAAQLLTNVAMALATVALILAVARVAFAVALPRQPLGYALAFVLAAASLFALGLVIAALAPNSRSAGGIGNIAFFPLMFFAGLWVPREAMPGVLRRVGDFTPLGAGVQALHDASTGSWPHPLQLVVMVAYLAVFGGLAAKLFRWE